MMKPTTHVTQFQITKLLYLSTVTVSKALCNHPDISQQTIRRVKMLASELGYTPDLIARAPAARKSNIIGVVLPEINYTFFATVMKGINTDLFNSFQSTDIKQEERICLLQIL